MRANKAITGLLGCSALLCFVMGVAGTGAAVADEGFTFHLDPLVIENLYTDVDTESAKFEEYRDLGTGFRLRQLDLFGESEALDREMELKLRNAGRDDARYMFDYERIGKYGLYVDYNKIPHRFGNDGRILHVRTGPGRWEIADPVQQAIQDDILAAPTVDFAFLDGLIQPYLAAEADVDLGLRRDRTLARIDLAKDRTVSWMLELTHENRVGTRPFGASFGFNNVEELPEPIDYDTSGALVRGEWVGQKSALQFGLRQSIFENNISTLVWDNAFRATDSSGGSAYLAPSGSSRDGSATGFADLAPDNEALSFFVSGRTRFASNWWANGNASYIQMTQDEPLLPYTLNSSIEGVDHETGATFQATDVTALPVRNADTQVDVLSLSGDAGTAFGEDWSLTFHARYYDYSNDSPRIEFPGYVRYHAVWEEIARVTVPYAYTKQNLGAELAWDVTDTTNLALEYDLESWDREFREIESSDQDSVKLSLDSRPNQQVSVRASYELVDRSIGEYLTEAQEFSFVEPEGINNQPGLRKYDEAAKDSDIYSVLVQFFPADVWSVSFNLSGQKDDYPESEFGLLSDEVKQYGAEVSFTPGARSSFYLFGHLAERDVFQKARQSGGSLSTSPADDWTIAFDESNDMWGLGWTGRPAEDWTFDVTTRWSKSDGGADFTTFGGTPSSGRPNGQAVDIDNYEDIELLDVTFKVDWAVSERFGATFWYAYEDYTIDSFILQGLRNYLPGALLLNADNGDYTANIFGVQMKFSF
ncbi:MAG: MtrB/PioB family outer membrane beta-barrel protein [Thermoanaerobaculia bacterium]